MFHATLAIPMRRDLIRIRKGLDSYHMRHCQQKLGCFSTAKLFMDMDDMDADSPVLTPFTPHPHKTI
jgi:hypothetical protein